MSFLQNGKAQLRQVITVLVVVFVIPKANGWEPGVGVAQPTNYPSSSGKYSLFVDPADRYGAGAAKYRFARNGVEIHSYNKPFTLREVTVTDDGLAAGMAYRDDAERAQFLHIVILAQDGREILNEAKKREVSHMHSPALPKVNQLLASQELDRFIARVLGPTEQLWVYKLSTGESLQRFDPRKSIGNTSVQGWIVDSKLVPGTPLLLVHGLMNAPDPKTKGYGAVFALIDLQGRAYGISKRTRTMPTWI